MARYSDPKCRVCRGAGVKLFLKGTRCFSPKCPVERRAGIPPGGLRKGRRRRAGLSDYGEQLREKQKAKNLYGVLERQFKRYYEEALKVQGATGDTLMRLLERRLDNAVFRLGFTPSRSVARQVVSHGQVTVDGRKVNISSFRVKPGMVIALRRGALDIPVVKVSLGKTDYVPPGWLERKAAVGRVMRLPNRDETETSVNDQLIVEYYSR